MKLTGRSTLVLGIVLTIFIAVCGVGLLCVVVSPSFGAEGPRDVPLRLDETLAANGTWSVGEEASKPGASYSVRVDAPIVKAGLLSLMVRTDFGPSVMALSIKINLADPSASRALVEVQRAWQGGTVYSHGRGLDGVVRINRRTLPGAGEGPLIVAFDLTDYAGGSPVQLPSAPIAFKPEDFR